MSYATTSDVATELGRPDPSGPEADQWQLWLDRVERRIEQLFRRAGLDLHDQIALDDPTLALVVDVEAAAVARKVQNPLWGETSRTEAHAIDDASGSHTYRREGDSATSDPLALLTSEIEALLPAGRGRRARAFSVMPS